MLDSRIPAATTALQQTTMAPTDLSSFGSSLQLRDQAMIRSTSVFMQGLWYGDCFDTGPSSGDTDLAGVWMLMLLWTSRGIGLYRTAHRLPQISRLRRD